MEKPMILRKCEFTNNLTAVVNQSGLPAFMLVDILRNLLAELDKRERMEISQAAKEWQASQEETERETE